MTPITKHYPGIPQIAFVINLASRILVSDRCIRLGDFFTALRKGSSKMKYGAIVSPYSSRFANLDGEQMWNLYETALAHLEHTYGPLRCRPEHTPCACGKVWGYAGIADSDEKLERGYMPKSPNWRQRALDDVHPDNKYALARGVMPKTEWHIAGGKR